MNFFFVTPALLLEAFSTRCTGHAIEVGVINQMQKIRKSDGKKTDKEFALDNRESRAFSMAKHGNSCCPYSRGCS